MNEFYIINYIKREKTILNDKTSYPYLFISNKSNTIMYK